jgi:signal transduction histidine kinase
MRRAGLAGLALAGAAVGILAEQQGYDWPAIRDWLPDLLAGWALIGLGLALVALGRDQGAAMLLLVAGFSWFALNFEATGPGTLQWLAGAAAYLHRAPLFQLAVAPPAGRPRTPLAAGGVTLAWTAVIVWPLWDGDVTSLVLCAAFVAIAGAGWARASGQRSRTIAGRGLVAAAVLATAIGADAIRSLVDGSQAAADVTVLWYAAAVVLAGALSFTAALLGAPAALAERAVALERRGATLGGALRELLGDRALEVGFATGTGDVVDDLGRPIGPPAPGLVSTAVTVSGEKAAVVIHDPSTLADPATRSAVLAAVGLAARRSRLRAEVGQRVAAVEVSQRRLLLAEEEERRRLADRLERGTGAELGEVERLVRAASSRTSGNDELDAALARALEQLERVRPELDALVRGLGGDHADGLVPALRRLAQHLPVRSELELAEVAVPSEVASTLWFVCSESLANTVKHARAGSVRVALAAENGLVRLTVEDDGRGGADPGGPGIAGLTDRVAALGGRLLVSSPNGAGTRVVAELPVGD